MIHRRRIVLDLQNVIILCFLVCVQIQHSIGFSIVPFHYGRSKVCHSRLIKEIQRPLVTQVLGKKQNDDDGMDDWVEEPPMELPADEQPDFAENELADMTVSQLKQQLRLRGLKVSGRKSELIHRLWTNIAGVTIDDDDDDNDEPQFLSAEEAAKQASKARQFAKEKGKNLVDVSAYLDPDDVGKEVKSNVAPSATSDSVDEEESSSMNEVWGSEARLMVSEDIEDKRLVVDSLSRTVLEYKGSNQTYVQAVVVATRDSLKQFLKGGGNQTATAPATTAAATEERLRELQLKREKASAKPRSREDEVGIDEGDETGIFKDILDRDFSDWGKYTATGAQMSAQEVQGILLLSDVYGAFSDDITALAEKIAFECQPVIVMVPDLFRGKPWTGPTDGVNEDGQSYEEWRASHDDLRVSVDIRAAAACMRETYGVSSVVVWGMCYGGGRALEAASGWVESVHDVDGTTIGPPPVEPSVAVVWYPTRYEAKTLFGKEHKGQNKSSDGETRKIAVMGVFAGKDTIPGATKEDASLLKKLLEEDDRVMDHMIKVFPDQNHGFAHQGVGETNVDNDPMERFVEEEFGGAGKLSFAEGDAEVACLLSTAFMETYSRVFLPTVGPSISLDENEKKWGKEINMNGIKESDLRNVRKEIEQAMDNFVEEPLESGPYIDPSDESQEDELKKILRSMEDPSYEGPYKIEDDDDITTIYAKLTASDENFQIF